MSIEFVTRHWALLSASILGWAVAMFVAWRMWQDSARGQLGTALRRLRARRQQRTTARLAVNLSRLAERADSVKPRQVQETTEALQDAEALLKIANDQVLIAANHVRRIIVEEFPPKRHEKMRGKYLHEADDSGRPFSF
jgi:hypothetical protein